MEVLQKEAAVRQKELSKAEKLTKKLRDELQSLNAHVSANMVGKADFEAYKRAVNEKVIINKVSTRKIWIRYVRKNDNSVQDSIRQKKKKNFVQDSIQQKFNFVQDSVHQKNLILCRTVSKLQLIFLQDSVQQNLHVILRRTYCILP